MKKLHRARDFLAGVLVTLLVASLALPVSAAITAKTIDVYTGISIFVDGLEMKPTDVNGNPVEVFVYNGTTYVPLRAVSQSMGKAVKYDGETQTVYIGEVPGESAYLMDVCPPYQTYQYEELPTVKMVGKTYTNAFRFAGNYVDGGWALYNLNGQYDVLTFEVGHIDGANMRDAAIYIYLDGELAYTVDLTSEMLPTYYEFSLRGALQMKIATSSYYGSNYAIVNPRLY